VIARVGRCSIEMQVRTLSQHLWAEVVERLGDRWGREIRYGGTPADGGRLIDQQMSRDEFWGFVKAIGQNLATIEEAAADQNFAVESGDAPIGMDRASLDQLQRDLHKVLGEWLEYIVTAREL